MRKQARVLKACIDDGKIDFRLVEDATHGTRSLPEQCKPAKRMRQEY